ncbi:MAG: hypothetical protein ACRD2H_16890 [Terriglobales bacterium]
MDVERTMQFILDAQARQAASLQAHAAFLQEHAANLQKHDAVMQKHAATLQVHAEALRKNDQQIATITDLFGRLAKAELRLVDDVRSLRRDAEARMNALDERLNILIDTADKLIRRNGRTH